MKKKRKLGRKLLSFLLTLAMVVGLMPGMSLTAYAGSEVSYQEGSWSNNSVAYATKTAENPTTLASDTTAWGEGNWYVVPANGVTISDRISVTGTVNLILTDGNTFTASKGITVAEGNTLNIYAQSEGDNAGELLINGVANYQAGIGGDGKYPSTKYDAGTVTIHGGKITVTGGSGDAGIGGSNMGNGGALTIYGGTIEATGKNGGAGIGGGKPYNSTGGNGGAVTIYGGKVKATATGYSGGAGIGGGYQGAGGTVTINGGTIEATGSENGAGIGGGKEGNGGTVIINGGTVTATGGSDASSGSGGAGIGSGSGGTGGTVTINGGMVTASGGYNSMGIGGVCGWQDDPESGGRKAAPPKNGSLTVNNGLKVYGGNSADPTTEITSEQLNEIYAENYNKTDVYRYMIVSAPPHTHSFTYTASGATITATCNTDGCTLTESKATLSIAAPSLSTYGGTGDAAATLDGLDAFNTATSKTIAATDIKYIGRDGTTYEENTTAPTDAGKYTAKITVEEKTAFVNYEIAKVNPTAPIGLTATYGQTLADVTLPDGWTWADSTQSVGNVVDPAVTFKANFAGDDNHNAASNVDVTVTVGKADPTAPTSLTATYGQTLANVTLPTGWTWADSTQSVGNVVDPAATFKANFAGDDNHNAASNVEVTVTVGKANAVAATVSANNRTYDGTEKPLVTVAGETIGGTLKIAVTTVDQEPDDGAYTFDTTSIPTATDAGT